MDRPKRAVSKIENLLLFSLNNFKTGQKQLLKNVRQEIGFSFEWKTDHTSSI